MLYLDKADLFFAVLRALLSVVGFPVLTGRGVPMQTKIGFLKLISMAIPVASLPESSGLITIMIISLSWQSKEVLIGLYDMLPVFL